jgi:hypothetical protein
MMNLAKETQASSKIDKPIHKLCFQLHEGLTFWKKEPYIFEFQYADVEWHPATASNYKDK